MKIADYRDVEAREVGDPGAKGVTIRWLISKKDGAPNFAMRLFEIRASGYTPYHSHDWEHEVFILKGNGNLVTENGARPLSEGCVVFVPGNENHQFKSGSDENLAFLCLVPIEK